MKVDRMHDPILEIAHVLFIDTVAYSTFPADRQRLAVRILQDAISCTSDYVRSRDNEQLIVLPTGDGAALVFFRDAEAPARCALDLATCFRKESAFQVRMGIHTGPVYRIADINANRNVTGGGINLAQRVMELADAGHILVSKAVADILGEVSTWRECLHDLGRAEVKHGLWLHVFNLYSETAGNPHAPSRLSSAPAVLPVSHSPKATSSDPEPAGNVHGDRIRVLSVDDHPLLREGIATLINNQPDMRVVSEASSGEEALERFRVVHPDVTLMDVRLPDMNGIDALIAIRKEFPNARILMVTTSEGTVEIQRALASGARGYMLKSMPPRDLVESIRRVYAGKKSIPSAIAAHLAEHYSDEALTAREVEVLQQVAAGSRNKKTAERLLISEEAVKVHIRHIMEKLGASDRAQAVAIGIKRGIIHL